MYAPYRVDIEQAVFRSTQSSGNTAYGPGNLGIGITANQLYQYMRFNEFTNVNTGINVSILPASYTSTNGVQYGINAKNLAILQSTFSANRGAPVGTTYLNNAVNISCPSSYPFTVPASNAYPYIYAISVEHNTVTQAFRGVGISGINGFQTSVQWNQINLIDDNTFSSPQYGVSLTNNIGLSTVPGQYIVSTNTLAGSSMINQQSLAFFDTNPGTISPSVTCNEASNSNDAFVFWGNNSGTQWTANTMLDHSYGLSLEYSGVIGQQGGPGFSCNDRWLGTSWGGSSYGTWVDNTSTAASSKLYVLNSQVPPNNGGTSTQIYVSPNLVVNSGGGFYDCVGIPGQRTSGGHVADKPEIPVSVKDQFAFFRMLEGSPDLVNGDAGYKAFYDQAKAGDFGKLSDVERSIFNGDYGVAEMRLSQIRNSTGDVTIETYRKFFSVYLSYLNRGNSENVAWSDVLAIAENCAGTHGPAVYQARALYRVHDPAYTFSENCGRKESRQALSLISEQTESAISIFPNPAIDLITVTGMDPKQSSNIEVLDVAGRRMAMTEVSNEAAVNIRLNLAPGVYLVKVSQDGRQAVTQRVIIRN